MENNDNNKEEMSGKVLRIPFDLAMRYGNNSEFVELPTLYFNDMFIGEKVDNLMNECCIPKIFVTDLTDTDVLKIKTRFIGSFSILYSRKIEKHVLITPYAKNAWSSELVTTRDEDFIKEIMSYIDDSKDNDNGCETIEFPLFYDKKNIN